MDTDSWQPLLEFTSPASAEAVAALLETEGVPSFVRAHKLVAGIEAKFELRVPRSLAHRARWVLAQSDFTDSELTYLATGELSEPE